MVKMVMVYCPKEEINVVIEDGECSFHLSTKNPEYGLSGCPYKNSEGCLLTLKRYKP